MSILAEIQNNINEFNEYNDIELAIDSIRIKFSKQYKLQQLKELGSWNKINSKDKRIMDKLKKRLFADEITSVYQLENYNIYYYNSNEDKPKYRNAMMVIFGLKQYHKAPLPYHIVEEIVSILKNVSNIDICIDLPYKPNLDNLQQYYILNRYFEPTNKILTDTYYINDTFNPMIDKFTIYNKTIKNNLSFICWRIEALIQIPNIKQLALPLDDINEIIILSKNM